MIPNLLEIAWSLELVFAIVEKTRAYISSHCTSSFSTRLFDGTTSLEFGVKLLYHTYTRPLWVECYTVRFCTHGRAHVSVGDLKRRFVSSDLCTYWFTFHSFFVFGVSTNLLVFNFKASELLNQILCPVTVNVYPC